MSSNRLRTCTKVLYLSLFFPFLPSFTFLFSLSMSSLSHPPPPVTHTRARTHSLTHSLARAFSHFLVHTHTYGMHTCPTCHTHALLLLYTTTITISSYESSGWKMSGSMAWSIDGVHWTPCATEAYNNSPEWVPAAAAGTVDGTRGGVGGGDLRWTMHNLTSRQRPLLHFGDVTNPGRPTHLYNGVQNCSQDTCNGIYDYSWNAVIPFK